MNGPGAANTRRSTSTLQPPSPQVDFTGFPVDVHGAGALRSRAHGTHSPWYFSSSPGRFNLKSPRGTLNTASSKEVAVREFLGIVLVGDAVIPASLITERWVSDLELPEIKAADFTAGSAFGVAPGDVTAPMDDDYVTTRAWATAMDAAHFGGIKSRSRFGTGEFPTCLYVFGDEGEHILGAIQGKTTMRAVINAMPECTIDSTPTSDTLIVDP